MSFKTLLARPCRRRRGQALAEFAVITVLLYLLVGGVLTLGYALYAAQGLQQAADVAAREISRTPLPADVTLDNPGDGVLYGNANAEVELQDVRQRVFNEHYLVLNVDTLQGKTSITELVASLPVVNQQLFPLMISDTVEGVRVIRYPGRVFRDNNNSDDPADPPPSGYLVDIPLTNGGSVPVIEEIDTESLPGDDTGPNADPMQLGSPHRGLVALRINYPLHSPFLVGFNQDAGGNNTPVAAEATPGLSTGPLGTGYGPYVGQQGFGRQNAMGGNVRPFRKLISGQAIYRREVFSGP